MEAHDIFSATLGLFHPWHVSSVTFSSQEKRLDITVDFISDGSCCCPLCGKQGQICEKARELWRHDNFFEYLTYLHVRVPLKKCIMCGDSEVERPWSREGSRFIQVE
jgi:transposase